MRGEPSDTHQSLSDSVRRSRGAPHPVLIFPTHTPKDHHVLSSFPPGSDLCSLPKSLRPFPLWPPRSKQRSARISGDYCRSNERQNIAMGQRGGCRKSGTLAKISARHEVGCMGLVRPEGRRFKEMNNPICCGMNRAFYRHHKKGKG